MSADSRSAVDAWQSRVRRSVCMCENSTCNERRGQAPKLCGVGAVLPALLHRAQLGGSAGFGKGTLAMEADRTRAPAIVAHNGDDARALTPQTETRNQSHDAKIAVPAGFARTNAVSLDRHRTQAPLCNKLRPSKPNSKQTYFQTLQQVVFELTAVIVPNRAEIKLRFDLAERHASFSLSLFSRGAGAEVVPSCKY